MMQSPGLASFNFNEESQKKMNLEDVVKQEAKLGELLIALRNENNPQQICEEWWEHTENMIIQMYRLSTFFKDEELKKQLEIAQKLEIIGVTVTQFMGVEDDKEIIVPLKNMIFYVHQANLLIIKLILNRLPQASKENVWAKKLIDLDSKLARPAVSKREIVQNLKMQNECTISILQNINKIKSSKFLFEIVLSMLDDIQYIPILKVREIMFNRENRMNVPSGPVFSQAQTAAGAHPFFDDDLPQVTEPFLPPLNPDEAESIYTLVLDLDETLVHYFDLGPDSHFLIRPGCFEFLEEMGKHFEVVIFTAAMQDYADSVLDQIDKTGVIQYRLYRQHTSPHGHLIAKDLSKLGRDLKRTLLLDNVADNFALQSDNGIFSTTWYDNMEDRELYDLIPLLRGLVVNQVKDVRITLQKFRDQMLRHIAAGNHNPISLLNK